MESPHLVRGEGSNDTMGNSAVVEEHEVLLRPVVWIYQLRQMLCDQGVIGTERYGPHLRIYRGTLHLVEDIPDLFQVSDMNAVRIESAVP